MNYDLRNGDCVEIMRSLPANSVDSIVTDPPYELGFMGKSWDSTGIAYSVRMWDEALRVLKPGGHLLAFSGSRTYHRMACAIEDAGFEIRDQIMWVYGSGFPKSMDVSKAIDKQSGVERQVVGQTMHARKGVAQAEERTTVAAGAYGEARIGDVTVATTDKAKQWAGWGTALKPAHEPIVMARKPLIGTVATNVIIHGTGALNIDGSRISTDEVFTNLPNRAWVNTNGQSYAESGHNHRDGSNTQAIEKLNTLGRWPANFIHDGLDEDWARFFYCAKASKKDRNAGLDEFEEKQQDESRKIGDVGGDNPRNRGVNVRANHHPTVKPTDLMRYLVKLVTPPNGTVLDPFTGSGSTGKAAMLEGFNFIGCELDPDYVAIANARIKHALDEQQGKLL